MARSDHSLVSSSQLGQVHAFMVRLFFRQTLFYFFIIIFFKALSRSVALWAHKGDWLHHTSPEDLPRKTETWHHFDRSRTRGLYASRRCIDMHIWGRHNPELPSTTPSYKGSAQAPQRLREPRGQSRPPVRLRCHLKVACGTGKPQSLVCHRQLKEKLPSLVSVKE